MAFWKKSKKKESLTVELSGATRRMDAPNAPKLAVKALADLQEVVNVEILADVSQSMGDERVQYMFGIAIPRILDGIISSSRTNGYAYNVGVIAFNNAVAEVIPFMHPNDALKRLSGIEVRSGGCTDTQKATEFAWDKIDEMKAKQDEQGAFHRLSSILVTISDGVPCVNGRNVSLDDEFVAKVLERAESRATIPMVIGMGKHIDEEVVKQLGPATEQGDRLARHGLLLKDESYGTASFDMIADLVAEGSSTTGGSPVLAYDGEVDTVGPDIVIVDPDAFTLVA